jgi:hypothetical protein
VTDDHTPELFPTFCPKAVGMIGRKLPPATMSRCIVIEQKRRKRGEDIVKFAHHDDLELTELRSRLLRWATDNVEGLRLAKPAVPEAFVNRGEDNWCLQFAIADLAGPAWGEKARMAALKIIAAADSRTAGARLLADIRSILEPEGGMPLDFMPSVELTETFARMPDAPWGEWSKGKPLSERKLAELLKEYGIIADRVRLPVGTRPHGYQRVRFQEAWERYL